MTSRMLCGYCVVGLLIGHEEGRKLTLLLPRRNKDNQQHVIIYYVTGMECSHVQIVVAG
jgi:hypothetical protein